MSFYKRSLRNRIFLSMLFLVIGASILIALVTINQYKEEAEDYHRERLRRKEASIKKQINYVLKNTTYQEITKKIPLIFKDKIFEIKDINKLELSFYDFNGKLLISSKTSFIKDTTNTHLKKSILDSIKQTIHKNYTKEFKEDNQNYKSSYSYITDRKFKPLAILNLKYRQDDDFLNKELRENLTRLAVAYLFMLLIAIVLSYILSKQITSSLNVISEKITKTRLNKRNKKIEVNEVSQELKTLISAYNSMIDELEKSAAQLATNEREAAWREMAKQVAHEIKNPLTPMRLTVQSFQRKFNPNDPEISEKLNDFSNTLIQQIDTMSSIASAFSTYAQMPAQKHEHLNVVKITKLALEIFNEKYIYFFSEKEEIIANFDRTQLIRVITNLVKNSIQAIRENQAKNPKIEVEVSEKNNWVIITVKDNGIGILEENIDKVFEPKFTTKTRGMGLGLAMVKKIVESYSGTITFTSVPNTETTFTVTFPV